MLQKLHLAVLFVLLANWGFAQGVTTASVKGKVVDEKGEPMPAATVVAVHEASGTQYGTITLEDGRFDLRGMRVGGPYTLTASFVGHKDQKQEGVFLQLNQSAMFVFVLAQNDQVLSEVTVKVDRSSVMNADRTGAETHVDNRTLTSLPTIARSQKDFTRLTPQSDGNSFGGRNSLFNNFSLDGSIFNNSFGLDYATPGGQADAQPVSLDALEQLQVSLAPFDVREGGFTGAGVNAVTKSGTNTFRGVLYNYFRNEAMVGSRVDGVDAPNTDFLTNQMGFSLGGPIVKNKLFFFVNGEFERRDQLAHGFVARDNASQTDPNVTSVYRSDIEAVQNHLRSTWGYEPGRYEGYNHLTSNDKLLVKLDWNISQQHKLMLRYNYLNAWKDILPHPEAFAGRGPQPYRLPFENSSYRIFNQIHSVVGELNSRFSNQLSNKLMVGYSAFRDKREPMSAPFPVVDIFDANGNLAISSGSEMFSTHNILNQNVLQFTDNLTYYANNHSITLGLNYEQFQFENSFNLFYYPWFTFGSVADFLAADATSHDFNGAVAAADKNPKAWSYVDVGQLGIYLQDEWQATDRLGLTLGLRVDMPIYLNEIPDDVSEVTNFAGWQNEKGESVRIDPAKWPGVNPLWAPRLGFNWDVMGNRTLQVRGGSGVFSGRIPFVWLGNQASNARIDKFYEFQVNATADGFKFPQTWKTNLAVDKKFDGGWLATFEALYSKDINAVVHRNYNMAPPSQQLSGTGDNRAIYAGFGETNLYSANVGKPDYFLDAGAIVLDNTNQGYQYSLTGQVKKSFEMGLEAMVAYTFQESKDLTSIPAEIAADAFQRNPVIGNANDPQFSYSRYGLKHRVIGSLNYRLQTKAGQTLFSAFFEAGKGGRYSFTYNGDLNRDNIPGNDLLYVPANASDIHFGTRVAGNLEPATNAAQQWAALDAFIEQDPYLSTRRGQYVERQGAMLPWYTQMDVRLAHQFDFQVAGQRNGLQVSLDILNVGNLLNSAWGVRQLTATRSPLSVVGHDANNVPYLSFDTNLKSSYVNDVSVLSKWQMQLGVRYIFN